jgi:hypothetical protein
MGQHAAPLSNALVHPPYTINNHNTREKPDQLGHNILSATASDCFFIVLLFVVSSLC